MEMLKEYVTPEIEIIEIDFTDVITASFGGNQDVDDNPWNF